MTERLWTRQELLDKLATAISETRNHPHLPVLERVLVEIEDLEARVMAGKPLDEEYRESLFFDVIATRELDDVTGTHRAYLDRLSEIAAQLIGRP